MDPSAAQLANVFLYNLDDLAEIAEENLAQREAEVAKCRAILAERTASLWPQVAHSLNQVEKTVTAQVAQRSADTPGTRFSPGRWKGLWSCHLDQRP